MIRTIFHLSLTCKALLGLDDNVQLKPSMGAAVGVLTTAVDASPRALILHALAQALHLKFANTFSVCQDSGILAHFPWIGSSGGQIDFALVPESLSHEPCYAAHLPVSTDHRAVFCACVSIRKEKKNWRSRIPKFWYLPSDDPVSHDGIRLDPGPVASGIKYNEATLQELSAAGAANVPSGGLVDIDSFSATIAACARKHGCTAGIPIDSFFESCHF